MTDGQKIGVLLGGFFVTMAVLVGVLIEAAKQDGEDEDPYSPVPVLLIKRSAPQAAEADMSNNWKYVDTQPLRMNEVELIFDCFQCGHTATVTDYVEVTYKHSGDKLMYAFVECVGDHPRFPVPYDWFHKRMYTEA